MFQFWICNYIKEKNEWEMIYIVRFYETINLIDNNQYDKINSLKYVFVDLVFHRIKQEMWMIHQQIYIQFHSEKD